MVEGGWCWFGATVVVVAMEGETGSSNASCIDDGVCADVFLVPRDRNSRIRENMEHAGIARGTTVGLSVPISLDRYSS